MGESPAADQRTLVPTWMAWCLLTTVILGLLLILNIGRVAVLTPFGELPADTAPPFIRSIDRAQSWVNQALSGAQAMAALLGLTGLVAATLYRNHRSAPLPDGLRVSGMLLGGVLTALEASGPVVLGLGFLQLIQDPTAARDLYSQAQFNAPNVVLCLVLALMFGNLSWVLHRSRPARITPTNNIAVESHTSTLRPDADPERIFRRP